MCVVLKCFVLFYVFSLSPGVYVGTLNLIASIPGPEVIKLFSISAQLSMKFQLLINVEIIKISEKFRFKTQKLVIYPANKC